MKKAFTSPFQPNFTRVSLRAATYSAFPYQWIDNIAMPNGTDHAYDMNVLLNDSDVDSGTHLAVASFDSVSAHGATITLNADGTLHYDPTGSSEIQGLGRGTNLIDS